MIIMELEQIITTLILTTITLTILRLFLKRKLRTTKLVQWYKHVSDKFHDHQLLKIPQYNDVDMLQENLMFHRVSHYLNSLECLEHSDGTNLFSCRNGNNDVFLTMDCNQRVLDTFLGARIWWTYEVSRCERERETRSFTMRIRKRDKRRVLRSYLQHIHVVSDEICLQKRELKLFIATSFSSSGGGSVGKWQRVPFTHPATMETIAMDVEVKNKVNLDLETFLKSKQYYHRLGRVWRRSYLLYGPSGTGKSSFVSAIARTLSYDVYDLDLSKVLDDAELKLLLLQTTPRSLILIEDFDKYVGTKTTQGGLSISGVMNFMDGVVNSCCDERVMVFTMTTKDDIDPAVLRPGRVDFHVHFPLCDFNNFKYLVSSYLGVKEHKLFPQVEEMFSSGATVSQAEIGELLMGNRNSPSRALKSVIAALQTSSSKVSVGEEDGCKGTPKNGYKSGRVSVDGSVDLVDGGGGVGLKDGAKELRKLYGLLRRKSNLSKSDSFDLGT